MFLVYIFIATACIISGMAFHGTINVFLDAPSLCIVFIPSTVLTIASYGSTNIRRAFSLSIPEEEEDINVLNNTASSFGMYCIWFGLISTLIGGVKILALWNEIESASQVGPAASVMLLPLTYGLCAHALIAKPFAERWKN